MTLTDAGPLVALLDKDDFQHAACVDAATRLAAGPLLTTWPSFTEAMYLLGGVGGYRYQRELWKLCKTGTLLLHEPTTGETESMTELMEKYQDLPMDLADASLVAAAELLGMRRVFTLDKDFFVYRLPDGTALEVVP